MLKKVSFGIILPLLLLSLASAGEGSGPGTTGANFLKMGVGARAAAMGGAFTALANDATALYWNPAGLAQLNETELSATYNSWFQGVSQGYFSMATPAFGGTFALGINYVDMGRLEGRNSEGEATGNFSASDIHTSCGIAFGEKFMFGFSGGVLRDTIDESTETAFLATGGILFKPTEQVALGIVYQNVGQKLGESPLPATLRGGLALEIGNITLALDMVSPNDNDTYFCGGVEVSLGSLLVVRGGYTTGQDEGEGYSAGIGFRSSTLGVDYAYVPYGDLGDTHRISLAMRW